MIRTDDNDICIDVHKNEQKIDNSVIKGNVRTYESSTEKRPTGFFEKDHLRVRK